MDIRTKTKWFFSTHSHTQKDVPIYLMYINIKYWLLCNRIAQCFYRSCTSNEGRNVKFIEASLQILASCWLCLCAGVCEWNLFGNLRNVLCVPDPRAFGSVDIHSAHIVYIQTLDRIYIDVCVCVFLYEV